MKSHLKTMSLCFMIAANLGMSLQHGGWHLVLAAESGLELFAHLRGRNALFQTAGSAAAAASYIGLGITHGPWWYFILAADVLLEYLALLRSYTSLKTAGAVTAAIAYGVLSLEEGWYILLVAHIVLELAGAFFASTGDMPRASSGDLVVDDFHRQQDTTMASSPFTRPMDGNIGVR